MMIEVRESIMVRPAQDTPQKVLWSSNADLVGGTFFVRSVYFYRPNGCSNFFDSNLLKEALSKVLVEFYPWGGRLSRDVNGRIAISCNGEGVLFVEAHTTSVLDDLKDFKPSMELNSLIPDFSDYGADISSYPLVAVQVTRFGCGGICLGVAMEHCVGDGLSGNHFTSSWSETTRGIDITLPPFIDRTLLRCRDPPTPKFPHVEYQLPHPSCIETHLPIKQSPANPDRNAIEMLKITRKELHILKAKSDNSYTSYEMLTAHLWRCLCKARGYPDDQETKFYVPVDGRSRLRPPLPPGYLGNAIFVATPSAMVGDLLNNPLSYAASKIHESLMRMDDEYMRSALDYLELQPNPTVIFPGNHPPWITSWARLPIYDVDFGWGRPIYVGPTWIPSEGQTFVLPSSANDGSLLVTLSLQSEHMNVFKKILYQF